MDVSEEDARITADVLVEADLRGIDSHGVARFRTYYVHGLRDGVIVARPQMQVVRETPATAVLDAGGGLGQVAAYRGMEQAIQKARERGGGMVAVRNSNHFGIAGYFATMALAHDCIGLAMTNSGALMVPTFGREAILGTNPIAVAAPAGCKSPFALDMATSVVAVGKVEVYDRLGKAIPVGWAIDERGVPTADAQRLLDTEEGQKGGGIAPLGGAGELLGGHKGYGLALWVEIFSAALSGAAFSAQAYPKDANGKALPAQLGHFLAAWQVDAFRPVYEFKETMDDLQGRLKHAPRAEGQGRIYIAGEKEYEERERRRQEGIPLDPKVGADLQSTAEEVGVVYDLA
jgi:LDH2 family malate/lactate/ureidoglycolate dehydrogenase